MSVVIKVEKLSKLYRLGEIGTGTLSRDVHRWWSTRVLKKEDPFLKIGQKNDRTVKGESDVVYSLKDINFEIEKGVATGIIGKNGAGKSTLLKLLSRVTSPSTGHIMIRGRVASLLEVGTGFHPELTGRENIFLNGAILGMRRAEINKKLDEIINFSGVERYIDTPVKRYSSGMYVRLAFAVAAHLESEILIVDEVLAVGDAEFQKKCLGKMGDVSSNDGRTVLFVSHNLHAVKKLCSQSILLENGLVKEIGPTGQVVDNYLMGDAETAPSVYINHNSKSLIHLFEAHIKRTDGTQTSLFSADEDILIEFIISKKSTIGSSFLHFTLVNSSGLMIFETDTIEQRLNTIATTELGYFSSLITIPKRFLNTGRYFLNLGIASKEAPGFQIESLVNFMSFEVVSDRTHRDPMRKSLSSMLLDWTTERINTY